MTDSYLLDTNTASYIIKGTVPAVRRRLAKISMERIAISAITEGELLFGVARQSDATRLQQIVDEFLLRVTVLPWDSGAARAYGPVRAMLERAGQPLGSLDLMIAAHALAVEAILVTNDRAFARIDTLKVEDWTVAEGV